ncbi:glycosyltransferase family 4 protein [Paraclostridium sp. AKS81]|uniref:glycosyltransferase family 4 protein n=1 Tax=Paraclostridium sp. AKS81 TaxID=2876117 RepID=UPI0021E0B141|nr:glycosyltransferase family 4 protein [Paraclostridium sp. AKS81]MCU9810317.1 glycosyltransferase family 4 protein [Paraclostridium sp. AKS81]
MKILHICSYYNTSALYKHLFKSVSKLEGIKQIVYIPMAKGGNICPKDYGTVRSKTEDYEGVNHIYREAFNKNDRYIFSLKNKKIINNLEKNVDIESIDFIHAHSLFVNGKVAYELKRKKSIEYIVAVRATDVDVFFEKMIHLRKIGINIMKEAKNIIFISHNLKNIVLNKYVPTKYRKEIEEKSIVLPNGLDLFWLKNNQKKQIGSKENLNLAYIGTLHKRKNIDKSIKVFEKLNDEGIKTKFRIIGGGPDRDEIYSYIKSSKYGDLCKIDQWLNSREELLSVYKNSDIYIMPSIKETFGISYLEAISQGTPIIYTRNDGVFGYFNEGEVGYSVNPDNINEIYESIIKIIENYNEISKNCIIKSQKFNWDEIAKDYMRLYQS